MRKLIYLLIVTFSIQSFSQELNCEVVVNAQFTGNENVQVFKTLERQLKEFINNTTWTNKTFKSQERINCSMVINISDYNGDNFRASVQVQSSRPVYGSSYSSSVYNYNDKDFDFKYLEFQNIVYNPTQFESNLVSVLSFHVYMLLGMDADTFSPKGGAEYYSQAQVILNYSQQENYKGWKLEDGNQSRFILIDNLLSDTYKEFRSVLYSYHREGLDEMSNDTKLGKLAIVNSIGLLKDMNNRRPNSYLMRVFFDAKAEEIQDIFSGGPTVNISDLVSTLSRIAPTHASKWRNINF